MIIRRMLTPDVLAALMRAEKWMDQEERPKRLAHSSPPSAGAVVRIEPQEQEQADLITKAERELFESLYLS
jgi:ABC-type nitrate/sulfonate/bicarbonate transport system substrate-binding protein